MIKLEGESRSYAPTDKKTDQHDGAVFTAFWVFFALTVSMIGNECGIFPQVRKEEKIVSPGELQVPNYSTSVEK